jgi:hypothetical protein
MRARQLRCAPPAGRQRVRVGRAGQGGGGGSESWAQAAPRLQWRATQLNSSRRKSSTWIHATVAVPLRSLGCGLLGHAHLCDAHSITFPPLAIAGDAGRTHAGKHRHGERGIKLLASRPLPRHRSGAHHRRRRQHSRSRWRPPRRRPPRSRQLGRSAAPAGRAACPCIRRRHRRAVSSPGCGGSDAAASPQRVGNLAHLPAHASPSLRAPRRTDGVRALARLENGRRSPACRVCARDLLCRRRAPLSREWRRRPPRMSPFSAAAKRATPCDRCSPSLPTPPVRACPLPIDRPPGAAPAAVPAEIAAQSHGASRIGGGGPPRVNRANLNPPPPPLPLHSRAARALTPSPAAADAHRRHGDAGQVAEGVGADGSGGGDGARCRRRRAHVAAAHQDRADAAEG